jgi:hypothetical protein
MFFSARSSRRSKLNRHVGEMRLSAQKLAQLGAANAQLGRCLANIDGVTA